MGRFLNRLSSVLRGASADRLLDAYLGPNRLTVLGYHRVLPLPAVDFRYNGENNSATPEMFARQMDYVAENFNVIDVEELASFVGRDRPLPPRPLLITFDDGYVDNLEHALPVLRQRSLPAVLFLITGRMDDPRPLWWDECAYYLHRTTREHADLPIVGATALRSPKHRRDCLARLLPRLRTLDPVQRQGTMQLLGTELEVARAPADRSLFLSWEQVRTLVENGVSCQSHTETHPVVSSLSREVFRGEIQRSATRLEAETGKRTIAFAFPFGGQGDYDKKALEVLDEAGCSLAFTTVEGPMPAKKVRRHPLEIMRVFVRYRDSMDAFVMKLMGMSAVKRIGYRFHGHN